jgi:hypothetical protein
VVQMPTDWRLPEHRREAFQRFYSFHLRHKAHPGMVYSFLPAIADAFDLDDDQRAWLAWLNGNTQNAVTSLMLLEAAPRHTDWAKAVDFWNTHFKALEWDTDRRHQKSKFGVATEQWFMEYGHGPADEWRREAFKGWEGMWDHAKGQPYFGRLSAWSGLEFARILMGGLPDMGSFLLDDKSGSQSHRNGLAFVAGYDSVYWDADTADMLGIVPELAQLGEDLLREAENRNVDDSTYFTHPDISRLTLESALCTYKSWHKPNRRYPGCYADMMYNRIKKAEARFGRKFDLLWETRQKDLPFYLRLEDNPNDPGLVPVKQNWYLETGHPIMLAYDYPDVFVDDFETEVRNGHFGQRKDPSWL